MSVDSDGTICATYEALADAADMSRATAVRAMSELVGAGLVQVSGEGPATFRYLSQQVLKALQKAPEKRTAGEGWRESRASKGGIIRAMNAAQRRAAASEAQVKALLDELHIARAAPAATSTTTLAWLKVESLHAVRCFDPDCDRCFQLERRIDEEADAGDAADAAADALESADEIRAAA
ncbi:MAG TPA: hypothetical protein VGF99_08405, partial [Myxococcota bacterium]